MLRISSWLLFLTLHAGDGLEPTDRLIPPGYQGNPWGPVATKARETGELPALPMTAGMKGWDRWGRSVLRDGDILFRRGDAHVLFGYFPFSKFIANASGSKYSHTGIVAIEGGAPFVYDSTKAGVRRQPFHVWVLDNVGPFGVKRLKADRRPAVPEILRFCRETFEHQVPFDYKLGLGDDSLYCVEMTEKAFRSAGLKLSEPVRIRDMERRKEFPICFFVFQQLSTLTLDQQIFFPGNERHGIWSSPLLEQVYPAPKPSPSPTPTPSSTAPTRAAARPSTSDGGPRKPAADRR